MTLGRYKGMWENNPGKLQFRYRGEFKSLHRAKEFQARLRAQGKKTRIITYVDGYGLYQQAKHDFRGKGFHVDYRRD